MQYFTSKSSKLASGITSRIAIASLALGFLALMAGCDSTGVITEPIAPHSKETTVSPATIQPSVIDGRIVFDDIDEFRIFMEAVIDKEDTYLDSVQASIDFVSLRSDTERLAEELGKDIDELEVVEDPFFATVLNPDGEFQVGDVVYKITRNYVYQVSEENLDYLNPIFLRNPEHVVLIQKTAYDPVVETFEIERANVDLGKTSDRRDSCTSSFGGERRRIKGQAWISNWLVYISATTEIESQRKRWFRWWHNRIQSVSLDADYSITVTRQNPWGFSYSNSYTGSYSHTKYDAAEIRKNLEWEIVEGGIATVRGWVSSDYSGARSDGAEASCSTNISR
ncbi:MAG: hypothetical protein F4120_09600 [Rhodothermaceae bacterium]|nr:hypothetical protein [Rhodothermaceae bacterium]MYI17854.1 hypothetical protein [Rhodothermaceae bacterium]